MDIIQIKQRKFDMLTLFFYFLICEHKKNFKFLSEN